MILKQLLTKRNKGFVALLSSGQQNFPKYQNQCFKCNLKPLKPHRSYHCSTCDRDIVYMDHHCMWINNCVGLNNYRFFLAFVLYLCTLLPLFVFPQFVERFYADKNVAGSGVTQSQGFWLTLLYGVRSLVYLMDVLLMFILPFYTVWNWRLALNGATQVEHTKKLFRFRDKADKCIELVGGGSRDRLHGIKGITHEETIVRSKHLRKRSSMKARQIQSGGISARSGQNTSALSTSADSSGVTGNSYHGLNLSDVESDDSFECDDDLMVQNPVEEDDEESIIVTAN